MRLVVLLSLALAACTDGSSDPPGDADIVAPEVTPDDPIPLANGKFVGTYRVPVSSPALEAAALYPVDDVEWEVNGTTITLEYDLPVGLVGGHLPILMTGTLDGDSIARLSSSQGTATCVATGLVITCLEIFANLGALPIDARVITQRATVEHPNGVVDREAIADGFASDPIGIVDFDIATPIPDDDDRD